MAEPTQHNPAHRPEKPLWEVVGQDEDASFTAMQGDEPDVLVRYETRSGVKGTIRVPRAVYSAEYVADQLTRRAHEYEKVAALKHHG